jgi:peptide-methionine (S)-S-oxide reductase
MTETERATLGGGCFWCIEAPLKRLRGVESVVSGYAGGDTPDPTYEAVCSGGTGHAEVVQVTYDPDVIAFEDLLDVFFALHDPTTADRQGPDVGSQYRSIVCYHDERQREVTERVIDRLEREGVYEGVVTEVTPLDAFYRAEEHHQDYFEKHPDKPYCRMQIPPKLAKVRETFPELVADDATA